MRARKAESFFKNDRLFSSTLSSLGALDNLGFSRRFLFLRFRRGNHSGQFLLSIYSLTAANFYFLRRYITSMIGIDWAESSNSFRFVDSRRELKPFGNTVWPFSRIRTESHGGAWCPRQEATQDPKEWLEINLHQVHVITAVETQGRFGNGQGQEYTEAYQLEYWRPKLGKWKRYRNYKGEEVSRIWFLFNEATVCFQMRICRTNSWNE